MKLYLQNNRALISIEKSPSVILRKALLQLGIEQ